MKQGIMLALLMIVFILFTSCKTNINGEVSKKIFVVNFEVEGEGNITATIDGKEIDSGASVEEGTLIEFKVLIDEKKYEIYKWEGANENRFDKTRARLIVSEDVAVEVIVKDKRPFEVTLSFASGGHGRIIAMVGDMEVHSEDRLMQDSKVDFEAIADEGYEVSSWSGATPNEKDNKYASAIAKADLKVLVLFAPIEKQINNKETSKN